MAASCVRMIWFVRDLSTTYQCLRYHTRNNDIYYQFMCTIFLILHFIENVHRSENKWSNSQRLNNPIDLTTVEFHEVKKIFVFQNLAVVELGERSNQLRDYGIQNKDTCKSVTIRATHFKFGMMGDIIVPHSVLQLLGPRQCCLQL